MQQFIACLQGGTHKQQTALLLVIFDIGLDRNCIKTHLSLCHRRQKGQQTNEYCQYLAIHCILLHRHHIFRYNYLNVRYQLHVATIVSCTFL